MGNIPEEVLLALAAKGGGGGGTSNYEDLSNKPQIGGVTLSGNKSASDLGLADSNTVQGILDGQSIDSFSDVETALNGKQASLSAGDYIDIDGNEISVQRVNVDDVNVTYSCSSGTITFVKKIGTETIDTLSVNINNYTPPVDVFGLYTLSNSQYSLYFKLENKVASDEHAVGYSDNIYSLSYDAVTEHFHIEDTDNKLVIKSEMDTALSNKQDTLTFDDTPTDNSNNPVKSNGIYDALTDKTDTDIVAADFNAGTSYTAGNYCIYEGKFYKFKASHSGAWSAADVDEIKIAGELTALKSGLTNKLDANVYAQFGCKNLNTYPYAHATRESHGITFTDNGDGSITVSGTNDGTDTSEFDCHSKSQTEPNTLVLPNGKYIISGCPNGGSNTTYSISAQCLKNDTTVTLGQDYGNGALVVLDGDDYSSDKVDIQFRIVIRRNQSFSEPVTFYPMIRPAGVADDTWEPYVKSNKQLTNELATKQPITDNTLQTTDKTIPGAINEVKSGLTNVNTLAEGAMSVVDSGYVANTVLYNNMFAFISFVSANKTWEENDLIATVPASAKPKTLLLITGNTSSNNIGIQIKINTDGEVVYFSTVGFEGRISFTVMYPII